jgi:hypothetical protein
VTNVFKFDEGGFLSVLGRLEARAARCHDAIDLWSTRLATGGTVVLFESGVSSRCRVLALVMDRGGMSEPPQGGCGRGETWVGVARGAESGSTAEPSSRITESQPLGSGYTFARILAGFDR